MASDDTTKMPGTPNKSRLEPPNKCFYLELDSSSEDSFLLPADQKVTTEMEAILQDINEKSKKLDKLDAMSKDIEELKETVETTADLLGQTRKELDTVTGRVKKVEKSVNRIARENLKLNDYATNARQLV